MPAKVTVTDGAAKIARDASNEDFQKFLAVCRYHKGKFEKKTGNWNIPSSNLTQFLESARKSFEVHSHGDVASTQAAEIERQKVLFDFESDSGMFAIHSRFDPDFNRLLSNKFGHISGISEYREFDHARLTNSFPLAQEIQRVLSNNGMGWRCSPEFDEAANRYIARRTASEAPIENIPIAIEYELMPHQNRAVRFIEKTGGKCLLGACMGSGKSNMALAYCALHRYRVLVICPKIVRRTWVNEAKKFFPDVFGTAKELSRYFEGDLKQYPLVSVNYEFVSKWTKKIDDGDFDVVIIDESHYLKNSDSKRWSNVFDAVYSIPKRILLSGTAVKNNRKELLPQLELIDFDMRGLAQSTTGQFWHRIASNYLSMPKGEILHFLPAKTTQHVHVIVDDPVEMPNTIEDISRCKVESAMSKASRTAEKIKDILDNSGESVLVFSDSMEVVLFLSDKFANDAIVHHGQLSDNRREEAKAQFQDPDCPRRVFISTRQSLAVGATLTRASVVLFNDLPWTAADIAQAEDRTHRIGQHHPVSVLWMIAENSGFDRTICQIIARKYAICKAVTEGKQITIEEREAANQSISWKNVIEEYWKGKKK